MCAGAGVVSLPMDPRWKGHFRLSRIKYLRAELEAERISYGELAEIEGEFAKIDPATLRDHPENATASDMLDELEARA